MRQIASESKWTPRSRPSSLVHLTRLSRCKPQPIASSGPRATSPTPCANFRDSASRRRSSKQYLTQLSLYLIGDRLMTSIRAGKTIEHLGRKNTSYELDNYGITEPARVYWNLNAPELYEEIARRNEGVFSNYGAMIVDTGEHTGRAAKDKAIVREPGSENKVFWGDVNK